MRVSAWDAGNGWGAVVSVGACLWPLKSWFRSVTGQRWSRSPFEHFVGARLHARERARQRCGPSKCAIVLAASKSNIEVFGFP